MAKSILLNQKVFFGGYNITPRTNAIALEQKNDLKETTCFGEAAKTRLPGIRDVKIGVDGFAELDATDAAMFANMSLATLPISVPAEGDTVGNVAYSFLAVQGTVNNEMKLGEVHKFTLGAEGTGALLRGRIFRNTSAAVSSNGGSTVQQLGATNTTPKKTLMGALHVVTASGTTPTLDVTVRSDDNSGMSSPVTRLTFAQKTGIGSEIVSASPNSADSYYDVRWSVGGTSPSFAFLFVLGLITELH